MNPSDYYAIAARLTARGVASARPPEEGEELGAYLALLAGWIMDAAEAMPKPEPVKTGPFIHPRADDHLIDHDAIALLRGDQLDPAKRGVAFTYKRGPIG